MIKLYNANCIEVLDNMIENNIKIDCIITDPPYDIETSGGGLYKQEDKKYVKELKTHNIVNGFDSEILEKLCKVQDKINMYFFCSQKQIIPLLDFFVKHKKCNYNIISWHKNNPVPACGNKYLTDTEFILFFREKGVKVHGNYSTKKTFYISNILTKTEKELAGHPTPKPVELLKNFVLNSTLENQTVLDPFMGSGSTGIACLNYNRNFIGIEINKNFFEAAKDNLKM